MFGYAEGAFVRTNCEAQGGVEKHLVCFCVGWGNGWLNMLRAKGGRGCRWILREFGGLPLLALDDQLPQGQVAFGPVARGAAADNLGRLTSRSEQVAKVRVHPVNASWNLRGARRESKQDAASNLIVSLGLQKACWVFCKPDS
jgi:hypothetical protein